MDLIFTGEVGAPPPTGSVEHAVLCACANRRAWPAMLRLRPGDFEAAIARLQGMGWGCNG